MGDPSLRLHTVYPVTNLSITQVSTTLQLNWTASADINILGYNIYRADTIAGTFTRLNSSPVIATTYNDISPFLSSNNVYMVRAVKAEVSASGSYQNMSEGIFVSSFINNTFTFTGNGNWSNAANWSNNQAPPSTLPQGFNIIIDHAPGGQCVLDVPQNISTGATITVRSGKVLVIPGLLNIQ